MTDEPPRLATLTSSFKLELPEDKQAEFINELFLLNLGRVHFCLNHPQNNSFELTLVSEKNNVKDIKKATEKVLDVFEIFKCNLLPNS